MPCYRPIKARKTDAGLAFDNLARRGDDQAPIELRCGQCIGCRLDRARDWSLRVHHEAQLHPQKCWLTLTYSNENLPPDGGLKHEHFQKFIRALRDAHPETKIRYYMCGEYGTQTNRPHYHACIFGYEFRDAKTWKQNALGHYVQTSPELDRLWTHGLATVGQLTEQSANYTARYILQKLTGDQGETHYTRIDENGEMHFLTPPYNRMSLKPGIGADWFHKYQSDVYPHDKLFVRGGRNHRVPAYYDKLYERTGADLDQVKQDRVLRAAEHQANNTRSRLAQREEVHHAKTRTLKRKEL